MTVLEKKRLWLSVFISLGVWSIFYGPALGFVLTFALLFHEYGHYYWMEREGITNKTMIMLPPLGALAISREPWPSLKAETRIALAGPGFGFLFALVLLVIQWLSESYTVSIAIWMICWFNLTNLCLPIAVLDGGRVIKSILLSITPRLAISFYYFSFVFLIVAATLYLSFFTLVLGYFLWQAVAIDLYETKRILSSGTLSGMSGKEILIYIILFALIGFGLYFIMVINGIQFNDFIKFLSAIR